MTTVLSSEYFPEKEVKFEDEVQGDKDEEDVDSDDTDKTTITKVDSRGWDAVDFQVEQPCSDEEFEEEEAEPEPFELKIPEVKEGQTDGLENRREWLVQNEAAKAYLDKRQKATTQHKRMLKELEVRIN